MRSVLPSVVLVAAVTLAAAACAPAVSAAAAGPRLPDLVQEIPGEIAVTSAETAPGVVEYRLGFRSAVRNLGDGPLVIQGSRPDRASLTMTASQVIHCKGCTRRVVRNVGRLRFVAEPDHRHWHLLGFDRYELRPQGATTSVVRDRKSGFCLGDRYAVTGIRLDARAPRPFYTSRCGLGKTDLLRIREGISVGYGDDYRAFLEGQYLPLTGLAAGRYVLVHRVNASRRLRETRYGNDASSVALDLSFTDGVPSVQVLRRCGGSARCAP